MLLDKGFDAGLSILLLICLIALEGAPLHLFGLRKISRAEALTACIVGVVLALLLFGIQRLLGNAQANVGAKNLAGLMGATGAGTIAGWVIVFLLGAFAEEIVFRGVLAVNLERLTRSRALSIVLSSVLFSAAHFQMGLVTLLCTFVCGLILGSLFLLYVRSLGVTVLAHFLMNTLLFAELLGR